jgi:hypothetical protein
MATPRPHAHAEALIPGGAPPARDSPGVLLATSQHGNILPAGPTVRRSGVHYQGSTPDPQLNEFSAALSEITAVVRDADSVQAIHVIQRFRKCHNGNET